MYSIPIVEISLPNSWLDLILTFYFLSLDNLQWGGWAKDPISGRKFKVPILYFVWYLPDRCFWNLCKFIWFLEMYVLSPKLLINGFNYFLLLFDEFSDDQKRASETLAAFIDLTNQVIWFLKTTAWFPGWFERSLKHFIQFQIMSNKIMNLSCDLI